MARQRTASALLVLFVLHIETPSQGTIGPPHSFASYERTGGIVDADLATNRSGDSVCAWREITFGSPSTQSHAVYVQRVQRGQDLGNPILVAAGQIEFPPYRNQLAALTSPRVRVALDDRGATLVIWDVPLVAAPSNLYYIGIKGRALDFGTGVLSSELDIHREEGDALDCSVALGPSAVDVRAQRWDRPSYAVVTFAANRTGPQGAVVRGGLEARTLVVSHGIGIQLGVGFPSIPVEPLPPLPPSFAGTVAFPTVVVNALGEGSIAWHRCRGVSSGLKIWEVRLRHFEVGSPITWTGGGTGGGAHGAVSTLSMDALAVPPFTVQLVMAHDGRLAVAWRELDASPAAHLATFTSGPQGPLPLAQTTLPLPGHLMGLAISNQGPLALVYWHTVPTIGLRAGLARADFESATLIDALPSVLSGSGFAHPGAYVSPYAYGLLQRLALSDTGELDTLVQVHPAGLARTHFVFPALRFSPAPSTTGGVFQLDLPGRRDDAYLLVLSSNDYGPLGHVLPDGRHFGFWPMDPITSASWGMQPFVAVTGVLDAFGRADIAFAVPELGGVLFASAVTGSFGAPFPTNLTSVSRLEPFSPP